MVRRYERERKRERVGERERLKEREYGCVNINVCVDIIMEVCV